MVLKLQMINQDAVLNNFSEIGAAKFTPGYELKLVMRLIQMDRPLRYVPINTATFSMEFLRSDGSTFTKTPTFLDQGDRSLITVTLTPTETTLLIGQNLEVEITEGSSVSAAILQAGIQNIHSTLGC